LAVALVALNASVSVVGPAGPRGIPVEDLHRLPGDTPERDTCLLPGELITEIVVPSSGRSLFMKLRDRASFEWALASAAISFQISNGLVSEARVAVGGLAAKPWRLTQVEELLVGRRIDAGLAGDAGTAAIADARPTHGAEFKVTLLRRLVERIVLAAGGIE
jgi:xanthine dehydrogenase YagS FAD-binding subunit